MDLMSQLFELTVNTNAFAEPASTVMMSPLWEAPKAIIPHQQIVYCESNQEERSPARAEDVKVAAANNALLTNIVTRNEGSEALERNKQA
jgi:hypothetical protein